MTQTCFNDFNHSAKAQNFWAADCDEDGGQRPESKSLSADQSVDVAVIGGGYTGVSCALRLAERGYRVALLEAVRIGERASGCNGGQASAAPRLPPERLEALLGQDAALDFWQTHQQAQEHLHQLLERYQIRCDWRPGVVQLAHNRRQAQRLQRRAQHLRQHYGCNHYRFLSDTSVRSLVDSPTVCGGLLDSKSGHLQPLKLLYGLADAAFAAGVQLYEASPVQKIERLKEGFVLRSEGRAVRADQVVLACNAYQWDLEPKLAGRMMSVHSSMLATAPLPDDLAESLLGRNLAAFDTRHLVHYWKRSTDNRLLFGGADSARLDASGERGDLARLQQMMVSIYPQLASIGIEYSWSARFAVSANRLPQLGQLQPGLYYAQGYSGDGLTLGIYAGSVLADALMGEGETLRVFSNLPRARWPLGRWGHRALLTLGLSWYGLQDRRGD